MKEIAEYLPVRAFNLAMTLFSYKVEINRKIQFKTFRTFHLNKRKYIVAKYAD